MYKRLSTIVRARHVAFFGLGSALVLAAGCTTSTEDRDESEPLGKVSAPLETSLAACGDGLDNDLDGLVDCVDPDCSGFPACNTVYSCDRTPRLFAVNGAGSDILTVDTTQNPFGFDVVGTLPFQVNGAGYNIKDGAFYGFRQNGSAAVDSHLYRIQKNPTATPPFTITDLSATAAGTITASIAADIDNDGNMWLREGTSIHRITLSTLTKTTTANANILGSDLAYNPDDSILYSYYRTGGNGVVTAFDTRTLTSRTAAVNITLTGGLTGETNANSTYGAQWFDTSGHLFVMRNGDGAIFGINLRTKTFAYLADGTATSGNDGATCSYVAAKLEICGNGVDDDGDGTTDESAAGNGCITVPDTDGDGIIDSFDLDDDNDGIPDTLEPGDTDGDGIPNRVDLDSDNDGIPDAVEAGHGKSVAGNTSVACSGAGAVTAATGICVSVQTGPATAVLNYAVRDTDGDGIPDFEDLDSDNDGLTDATEVAIGKDANGDGIYDCVGGYGTNGLCNAAESPADSGVTNYDGNGAGGPDAARDTDGDGVPDYRDLDSDNDGLDDVVEAGGVDADGNGRVDPLDATPDTNRNGLVDRVDPGEGGAALAPVNSDNDALPDFRDLDSDNDGWSDLVEGGSGGTDANSDGVVDGADADGDGIRDSVDGLAGFGDSASPPVPNADGTGPADYRALDRDGDGIFDIQGTTLGGLDANNDGRIDAPADADGDGIADGADTAPAAFGGLGSADKDKDGLTDAREAVVGSDPNDADTDDDGLLDGNEPSPGVDSDGDGLINVLDPDSDNDGLYDGTELGHGCSSPNTDLTKRHCIADADPATKTNPLNRDTDSGGKSDGSEDPNRNGKVDPGEKDPTTGHGADDATVVDTDGDGLSDALEQAIGSSPTDTDSDDDGVPDGLEPNPADDTDGDGRRNVVDPDSDDDGLFDGTEMGLDCSNAGTDPLAANCIADAEPATKTSPLLKDTDNGGVIDGSEDTNRNGKVDAGETDPLVKADDNGVPNADADNDGLSDVLERQIGTNPNDADSDDDGVPDGLEPNFTDDTDGDGLINALDPDSDNDGLFDGTELGRSCSGPGTDAAKGRCIADADPTTTTSPLNPDTDGGGKRDGAEDANRNGKVDPGEGDPNVAADDAGLTDSDGDGLTDIVEASIGTNPNDADSDDDGLLDGLEPNPTDDQDGDGLKNALDPDSDGDGLFDGTEAGKSCNDASTDKTKNVCIEDADPATTTSVLLRDTDKGGVPDGTEDTNKNGKVDPNERNPNLASDDGNTTEPDADGDGLPDAVEAQIGTNPNDADSDDDGVPDGLEPKAGEDTDGDGLINALDPDSDNDGLFDGTELGRSCSGAGTDAAKGRCVPDADPATKTDPLDRDTDKGGVSDGSEDANRNGKVDPGEGDPNVKADDAGLADTDGDGLTDAAETALGTNPNDADSDDDGLLDGLEPNPADDMDGDGIKNVLDPDTDGDGLFDGTEAGKDCKNPATDTTKGTCIADADPATTTRVLLRDTDRGSVADGTEDANHDGKVDPGERDPNVASDDKNATDTDTDGDGLPDAVEAQIGTNPNDADTDDDGVPDGQEPKPGEDTDGDGLVNALDPDSDNDGLFDGTELGLGCANQATNTSRNRCIADTDPATKTDPLARDTDKGGVSDGSEDANHNGKVDAGEGDPNLASDDATIKDTDGDGLSDALEATLGTNPNDSDSDDDGLLDGLEANPSVDDDGDGKTNALDPDSDNDGLFDGTESGKDCSNASTDKSKNTCIADADPASKTSVLIPDTDGGGKADGVEDANHNGKVDSGETDPLVKADDGRVPTNLGTDGGTTTPAAAPEGVLEGGGFSCGVTPGGTTEGLSTFALLGLCVASVTRRRRKAS